MVDLSFCCLENGLNGNGFTGEAFQQAGCSGKRKPNQQPVQGSPRHVKRRWRCQPQTETVEAIHQIAGKSLPQARAKSRDEIRRTILVRQQVSHPPGGEDGENKSNPMVCFTHISASLRIEAAAGKRNYHQSTSPCRDQAFTFVSPYSETSTGPPDTERRRSCDPRS